MAGDNDPSQVALHGLLHVTVCKKGVAMVMRHCATLLASEGEFSMSTESGQVPAKNTKKRKKASQERLMVMFTLFFIIGILLLVLIPEGNSMRGVAMSLYSVAVFWAMFRFGI
jgi:hypothetical protein